MRVFRTEHFVQLSAELKMLSVELLLDRLFRTVNAMKADSVRFEKCTWNN